MFLLFLLFKYYSKYYSKYYISKYSKTYKTIEDVGECWS